MANIGAAIIGTGSCLPEKVLTNFDFEKILDTSDEWITTRTGIKKRHVCSDEESTVDIGVKAARAALDSACLTPDKIDLIITATFTPDMPLPSASCLIQQKLGIKNCGAFDLAAACSGFIYALSTATQFIKTGVYKNVLVIGAEAITRFTDYKDRGSCILFGDGAGAVVLSAVNETDRGVQYTKLAADGEGWPLLFIPGGGSKKPASAATLENRDHYIKMQGREIYKFAVTKMQSLIEDAMQQCNLTVDDVAMIVPHQVNQRIIDSACSHLGFPGEKVFVNIDQTGNTSSASIPIALDQAMQSGKVKKGDTIIMVAFGAGLTWASSVIKM
ncbi:MAG: ketoacyl-ACP synthase III [Phycisphaerae bacterium]|jgi:3-oxoacyl-[acyl-carrier-protein] synthase-3|nr:ketoacyl-ACP synthase III [Phycisphaerae bacterium]